MVEECASLPTESLGTPTKPARKVAVVVAALGRERRHLRFFLESLRRNFLPGLEKRFFVFTDGEPISAEDVTSIPVAVTEPGRVYSERCRWMLESEVEFAGYDYIFIMKPQVRVMEPVDSEVVLSGQMVACLHSAHEGEEPQKIRFEENKASVTWMAPGEGKCYFCGSWQGGERKSFMAAVSLIREWMEQDRAAGVRPLWGEESYWNRYWADLPPDQILGSEYAWRIGTKFPKGRPPKVLVHPLDERESKAAATARPVRRKARR